MPASPIRKLVPYAEKAKLRGMKIYHLNIGQPDIETPHQMIDAVKRTELKVLEYSHSAGFESSQTCVLTNTSLVPMTFQLHILGDGIDPVLRCREAFESLQRISTHSYNSPKEFEEKLILALM